MERPFAEIVSGDLVWLIPAAVGATIVVVALLRLLVSRRNAWALSLLVAFGGVLSALSLIAKVNFGADGFSVETVAAVRDASAELGNAVGANTQAIADIRTAVAELQELSAGLADGLVSANSVTGSIRGTGDVTMSADAITKLNRTIVETLSKAETSIEASKAAELNALRNIETLNRLIEQRQPAR